LGRLERYRGLLAALRTNRAGFHSAEPGSFGNRAQHRDPFCFAGLAAFRFVFELLVVKEQLFASGECKLRATVDALENFVLEFH